MSLRIKALFLSLIIAATAPAFGSVEPDKTAHFFVSGTISGATFVALSGDDVSKSKRYANSVAFALILGFGKELFLDERLDKNDLAANALGALAGPLLVWEF